MNIALAQEARRALETTSEFQKFRMKDRGKKIYIGDEQREGWSGKLPFYLFWCSACSHYAKDYPHGHIERRYLICSFCDCKHDFVPWWVPWRMLYETIRLVARYRFSKKI